MSIEIIVPRLGWSMEEGAFVAWLKKDGEHVHAGELLFSIEGDKAIQEIESIDSGVLQIVANGPNAGDPIRVGDVLGYLISTNEALQKREPMPGVRAVASPASSDAPAFADSSLVVSQVPPSHVPQPTSTPSISPRALRVAGELGVDWTAIQGSGRTGRIREKDVRSAAAGPTPSDLAVPRDVMLLPGITAKPLKVLVTGGAGFIGTWVVRELLERGLAAVVLDEAERPARWERVLGAGSQDVLLIRGSLLDRKLLAGVFTEQHVTHVIHLAAFLTPACQADPWEGCRVNVLGSMALLEQVRLSAGQVQGFSYASSVAVFGDESDHADNGGGSVNEPSTFYGVFKKAIELAAAQYWRHFQIASLGIRPQVAYGPEREVGLTAGPSLAARAAVRGEEFCISYTGRIGYDYVEDVARAFVRGALETPRGAQVVDLTGEVADVSRVIEAIASSVPDAALRLSASGPPISTLAPPTPSCISTIYPDWRTTPLVEGIRRTVEFYRVLTH